MCVLQPQPHAAQVGRVAHRDQRRPVAVARYDAGHHIRLRLCASCSSCSCTVVTSSSGGSTIRPLEVINIAQPPRPHTFVIHKQPHPHQPHLQQHHQDVDAEEDPGGEHGEKGGQARIGHLLILGQVLFQQRPALVLQLLLALQLARLLHVHVQEVEPSELGCVHAFGVVDVLQGEAEGGAEGRAAADDVDALAFGLFEEFAVGQPDRAADPVGLVDVQEEEE